MSPLSPFAPLSPFNPGTPERPGSPFAPGRPWDRKTQIKVKLYVFLYSKLPYVGLVIQLLNVEMPNLLL